MQVLYRRWLASIRALIYAIEHLFFIVGQSERPGKRRCLGIVPVNIGQNEMGNSSGILKLLLVKKLHCYHQTTRKTS